MRKDRSETSKTWFMTAESLGRQLKEKFWKHQFLTSECFYFKWVSVSNWLTEHTYVGIYSYYIYDTKYAKSLSHVWVFATSWTVAHQAPLSMGFSRQEYWSELPYPPPRDLLTQELNPYLLQLPHCRQLLHLWATREAPYGKEYIYYFSYCFSLWFITVDWI